MEIIFSSNEENQIMRKFHMLWLKMMQKNFYPYLKEFIGKKINALEIGVFRGQTSRWLLDNILTNSESVLYGIDPWKREYFDRHDVRNDEVWNGVLSSIAEIKNKYKNKVEYIKGKSEDVLIKPEYKNLTFNAIYIDGDHTYKSVIRDFNLVWPMLNKNGVLIFDDYMLRDRSKKDVSGWVMEMQFAIDKLLYENYGKYKLLFKNRQVGLRKLVDDI